MKSINVLLVSINGCFVNSTSVTFSVGINYFSWLCLQLAVSLCIVHVMGKLSISDAGSVSLSLVEKINKISEKVSFTGLVDCLTAFGVYITVPIIKSIQFIKCTFLPTQLP